MKMILQKLVTLLTPFLGRYLLIVGLVATLGAAGYQIYVERAARLAAQHELVGKTEAARRLTDKVTTLEKSFATETQALAAIKKENAVLAEALKKAKLRPHVSVQVGVPVTKPNVVTETPSVKPNQPFPRTYFLFLGDEGRSPLAGTVEVRSDGSAQKTITELNLSVNLHVLDRTDGGSEVVAEAFFEQGGKKFPAVMDKAKVLVVPRTPQGMDPAPSFRWTLGLSMTGLWLPLRQAALGGDVSVAGYGPTDRDLTWRFIHLGAAYTTEGSFAFYAAPFSWRPFPKILKNTYVIPAWTWPMAGYGTPALGLSVQL
jgi:Tfp pilus assembly protein PilE